MRRRASALTAGVLSLLLAGTSMTEARELYVSPEGEYVFFLKSSFRSTWLLSLPNDDPLLPQETTGAGFFRLRLEAGADLTEYATTAVAYEQRAFANSQAGTGVAAFLPPTAPGPFRLVPLDWSIVDQPPNYLHRQEFDRAFVAFHLPFGELTLGRQAIGLGRGVLFSAVDVFSPFTPTEVDREWRRGVDAVHAEIPIPGVPELSADLMAAFGDIQDGRLDSWAALGRIRAVLGDFDASLIFGRRDEDNLVGSAASATIGDAAVHGELALFDTDGRGIEGGVFGSDTWVLKSVAGASYMFDIGRGLRTVLEYHHSGFGLANVGQNPDLLFDPDFQRRFLRGDTQILGQHVIALTLSTDIFDDLSGSVMYLQSPADGSGLVAPTLTWNHSDYATFLLNVFAPWGTPPEGGIPRSEWGSSPVTVLLQARFYD